MRAAVSASLSLLLAAAPWGAARAGGEMIVSIEGCSMRGAEVTRLVQLELSSVLAAGVDPSAYRVAIRCEGASLHLTLFDPLTQKSLARTVVAPGPGQPEPERLVALSVAQLYRAAWLELSAEDPAPLAPSPPEEHPPEEIATARRAAEKLVSDRPSAARPGATETNGGAQASQGTPPAKTGTSAPTQPPVRTWSFGVALGARARHAEAPVVLPALEVTATWAPSAVRPFWLLAYIGMEWTDVTRSTGVLETSLVRAGAGVGMQPVGWGRWSALVEAAAGVTYLSISGVATDARYAGKQLGGAGFDASVAAGLSARIDPIRFALVGRVGVLAGTPAGIVAGDDDLSLDGLWAGGELRFDGVW